MILRSLLRGLRRGRWSSAVLALSYVLSASSASPSAFISPSCTRSFSPVTTYRQTPLATVSTDDGDTMASRRPKVPQLVEDLWRNVSTSKVNLSALSLPPIPLSLPSMPSLPSGMGDWWKGGPNAGEALAKWAVKYGILKKSYKAVGLNVDVEVGSLWDVLNGNLPKIHVGFDELYLDKLQITGGGEFTVSGLSIQVPSLLVPNSWPILRKPFEVFGDYSFTNDDILKTTLFQTTLQDMATKACASALAKLQLITLDLRITYVKLRDKRLEIGGEVLVGEGDGGGKGREFVLLTGIGLAEHGHVMYMDRPELIYRPNAGFPRRRRIPIGSMRGFDCDIGDNARIDRISIDDQHGIHIHSRALITATTTFDVVPPRKRAAFYTDVGGYLSSYWGFTQTDEYEDDDHWE